MEGAGPSPGRVLVRLRLFVSAERVEHASLAMRATSPRLSSAPPRARRHLDATEASDTRARAGAHVGRAPPAPGAARSRSASVSESNTDSRLQATPRQRPDVHVATWRRRTGERPARPSTVRAMDQDEHVERDERARQDGSIGRAHGKTRETSEAVVVSGSNARAEALAQESVRGGRLRGPAVRRVSRREDEPP